MVARFIPSVNEFSISCSFLQFSSRFHLPSLSPPLVLAFCSICYFLFIFILHYIFTAPSFHSPFASSFLFPSLRFFSVFFIYIFRSCLQSSRPLHPLTAIPFSLSPFFFFFFLIHYFSTISSFPSLSLVTTLSLLLLLLLFLFPFFLYFQFFFFHFHVRFRLVATLRFLVLFPLFVLSLFFNLFSTFL